MSAKRILLPTDLSDTADRAMRQAVELAVQLGAPLDVFHVVTLHSDDPNHVKDALEDYLSKLEKEVFADLSERSNAIRQRGVKVEITLGRSVSAAEAIIDKAQELDAGLIVMGTHGRSGVSRLLMGSVATQVVQHAACNVLTVGTNANVAEGTNGFDRILVPVDFTEHSDNAIDLAKALVSPEGKLVLQHVVSAPIHPSFYAGGVTAMFQLDPSLPDRIGKKLGALYDGASEIVVVEGDPSREILEASASHDAQMIVMGTRGLSGLDHVLLGSVTERVLRKAAVPVLAVK